MINTFKKFFSQISIWLEPKKKINSQNKKNIFFLLLLESLFFYFIFFFIEADLRAFWADFDNETSELSQLLREYGPFLKMFCFYCTGNQKIILYQSNYFYPPSPKIFANNNKIIKKKKDKVFLTLSFTR